MRESIFTDYEMPEVYVILGALQSRLDQMIFSCERPDFEDESIKESTNDRLSRAFGKQKITNKECDLVLKEVHKNFLEMSKAFLIVDETAIDETMIEM
jgi:hypothetical protein